MTACDTAAALGTPLAQTEPNYHIVGFDEAIYPDIISRPGAGWTTPSTRAGR